MISIGVIGCGHWGPNHIRTFSQLADSEVVMCSDLEQDRLTAIKNLFPHIKITKDYRDILSTDDVDAVCIVTPTASHFQIAKESLESGKHVLCEKPLAISAKECQELGRLAQENSKILMVGHVFLFNEGIVQLKKYLSQGELGNIYYAHSERTNLGPFRYDVNALWDLAPHDISIFNYLFDSCPINVSARGQKCLKTSLEDLAFVTLEYPNNILVNIHVSWLDPRKVRQITIVGDEKMIVWDDLDNMGPIRLYDKHVERTEVFYETYGEFQLLSKEGSVMIPKIAIKEPLKNQNQYFLDCIKNNRLPDVSDAKKGEDVVRTLLAISESMNNGGSPVKIS
ncbi:MAG: Gfo/Idh/MocA family oxidoreductase [Candidatus Omnitrophica bacterium]|nr:Gfo/Idh/MocA family oxidoreductase [Candidatus Omnitrophota bacterium]